MTALKDRFWAKVVFKEFIRHYRKMTAEQKAADIDASMDALEDLDDTGNSFGSKMVRWSMDRVDQYPMAQENGKKGGRPRKDTTADGDIREDSQAKYDGSAITRNETRVFDALGPSANHYGPRQAKNGDAATREGADESTTVSRNMRRVPQNEAPAHGFSGGRTAQGTMSRSPEAAAQSGKAYDQENGKASADEARQSQARESQRRAGADSVRGTPLHSAPARSSGPMPEDKQAVMDFASLEGLDVDDAYECWNVTVNERDGKTADGKKITNWKAYVRKWCVTRASNRRTA